MGYLGWTSRSGASQRTGHLPSDRGVAPAHQGDLGELIRELILESRTPILRLIFSAVEPSVILSVGKIL